MEGFITFLLFFAVFLWVAKRVFPIVLAWYIKRKIKDGRAFYSGMNKKEEGKVIISDVPQKEKIIDKEFGEYVDFEEQ